MHGQFKQVLPVPLPSWYFYQAMIATESRKRISPTDMRVAEHRIKLSGYQPLWQPMPEELSRNLISATCRPSLKRRVHVRVDVIGIAIYVVLFRIEPSLAES